MVKLKRGIFLLLILLMLGGCATLPTGPSVMVLPPPNKPFEQFQAEDAICRQWAAQQIGLSPQETVNQNTATGAVVGTAIGAGLGAVIGSVSGSAGAGAAIGAGSGLLVGTASGANAGQVYGYEAQRRYDIAYQQCMYAKGNQIPGVVRRTRTIQRVPPPPPPPGYGSPPPPWP
jgi:Glycine-zipper domain